MRLRPALWQTCRVVANETRLQLLQVLYSNGELTVTQLASLTGMSASNASFQLKILRERGLVICRRKKMEVFYRVQANDAVAFAPEIIAALQDCFERAVSLQTLIRNATAFTHERRIEILRALHGRSLGAAELQELTGMSSSALWRHLDKLIRRGCVKTRDRTYRISRVSNPLGRALLNLAVR